MAALVVTLQDSIKRLVEPRRSVVIALAILALWSTEWIVSRSLGPVLLDSVLFALLALSGPGLWRFVASKEGPAAWVWSISYVAYAALASTLVYIAGRAVGIDHTYVLEPMSLPAVSVLFALAGWVLGRDMDLDSEVRAQTQRAVDLGRAAEHSKLLALRTQLDPHFLFNTLNAIAEWCREDPLVAEAATLKLSTLLREVFESLSTPTWSLHRELALLEGLGELYRIRDSERFVFRFELDSSLEKATVPALLLLPLFENAIKHGAAKGHRGILKVVAKSAGTGILVEMNNPGAFAGPRDGGEGINITRQRLEQTYGKKSSLEFSTDGTTTTTTLLLPTSEAAS